MDGALADVTTARTAAPLRSDAPAAAFAPRPAEAPDLLLPVTAGLEAQLARKSREFLARGHTSLRVTLDPPSLGRLRVDLELSEHRAVARIVAHSPEAAALLQRDRQELVRAFQQQGIHDVSVHVESRSPETAGGRDGEDRPGDEAGNVPAPADTSDDRSVRPGSRSGPWRIDLVA
jgi:flagellar hook-length control protein FliK